MGLTEVGNPTTQRGQDATLTKKEFRELPGRLIQIKVRFTVTQREPETTQTKTRMAMVALLAAHTARQLKGQSSRL